MRAVKRYLPRAQSSDIIRELSDELRSQLEEKESLLGRSMSDEEVMAFLKQHGDPMTVARRYRQDSPSLTIGWELIGPELFPMYLILLSVNLIITVGCVAIAFLLMHPPITFDVFVFPVLVQIIVLTLVFIGLNLVRRKYPQPWYYPPAELSPMIPIPRGYSIAGLILWGPVLLWWLALMMHVSGLFYPLPKFLRAIAPVWPTYHLQQLFFSAIGMPSQGGAITHIVVLVILTIVLTVFAVRRLALKG